MAARLPRSASLPIATLALASALLLGACGQSMDTPLPDLANKKAPPDGRKVLSKAEQQQAIDALIAKRDKAEAAK